MNHLFGFEGEPGCIELRKRLDAFYESTREYTAFHQPNSKPEFWKPIKAAVEECLVRQGQCRILEFGAGRTGFGDYLGDIRHKVIFDVQDITALNREYLSKEADNVFICDIQIIKHSYDIIFSTFVWEHITTPREALDLLLNLLNPGGSIFIASPRYDFPFYLSPSARHRSRFERFKIGVWLSYRRLKVILGGQPDFLIHLDPSLFYSSCFRDSDAIHWVSIWDLKRFLKSRNFKAHALPLKAQGIKAWFWQKFLLLFVRISKDC
ncbi:MAG: methyltransferase domain-containing protein [Oscillatoria sp. Prado101]|nr:methyltransferase domain-containing protein [Oscillatoria sp. Prado101]